MWKWHANGFVLNEPKSYPAWGYFTHQCISYGRTAKTTKLLNNSVTGRNFKKIFLQWLLRHAIITLFEKNLRNYEVNMIKKKIKSKFCIFDQKNSDNSKTPLSIPDFVCVCVLLAMRKMYGYQKFWKKNKNFFFCIIGVVLRKNWKNLRF